MLCAAGAVTPPYAVEPEIEGFEALIGEAAALCASSVSPAAAFSPF
jgi:hypothetical protein